MRIFKLIRKTHSESTKLLKSFLFLEKEKESFKTLISLKKRVFMFLRKKIIQGPIEVE
jgi:hypothetical protein